MEKRWCTGQNNYVVEMEIGVSMTPSFCAFNLLDNDNDCKMGVRFFSLSLPSWFQKREDISNMLFSIIEAYLTWTIKEDMSLIAWSDLLMVIWWWKNSIRSNDKRKMALLWSQRTLHVIYSRFLSLIKVNQSIIHLPFVDLIFSF